MAKKKYCIRSSRTHEECSRGCLFGRDGHRREGASSCRGGGRRRQTTSDSEPPYCRRLLRANCASSTRPYGTRSLCCVLWIVATVGTRTSPDLQDTVLRQSHMPQLPEHESQAVSLSSMFVVFGRRTRGLKQRRERDVVKGKGFIKGTVRQR